MLENDWKDWLKKWAIPCIPQHKRRLEDKHLQNSFIGRSQRGRERPHIASPNGDGPTLKGECKIMNAPLPLQAEAHPLLKAEFRMANVEVWIKPLPLPMETYPQVNFECGRYGH